MKDTLIDTPRAEECLFKARGTGRAGPTDKRHLTLACNTSNEPE